MGGALQISCRPDKVVIFKYDFINEPGWHTDNAECHWQRRKASLLKYGGRKTQLLLLSFTEFPWHFFAFLMTFRSIS